MSGNPTYRDLASLRGGRYDGDRTEHAKEDDIAFLHDDDSHRAIAEPNTILRGLVGSTVHGLVLGGTDDRDEMGVCVEPRRYVVGFGNFEQWVYRSAAEREAHAGAALMRAILI